MAPVTSVVPFSVMDIFASRSLGSTTLVILAPTVFVPSRFLISYFTPWGNSTVPPMPPASSWNAQVREEGMVTLTTSFGAFTVPTNAISELTGDSPSTE